MTDRRHDGGDGWRMGLVAIPLLIAACGPASSPASTTVPTTLLPVPSASLAASPASSSDVRATVCGRLEAVGVQIDALRAVELRVLNRVALEIALGGLEAAYDELGQTDLGGLEEQLETPLRRLGYRLDEVALAVEDFRTNPRAQRAAPHVEEDSGIFADDLADLILLVGC